MNSSVADAFDALMPHLNARDTTLIALSGAPIEKLGVSPAHGMEL